MRIAILGGYGVFGGRLAGLLADTEATLIIAGRSREKAAAFCNRFDAIARLEPAVVDREGDLVETLRNLKPDIIIDATGPFQAYGDNPYTVAQAALELNCDYLDFADGSEFVAGIDKLDEIAKIKGRFVLSGVSSFPVLTAAVVQRLASDRMAVESIHAGIAPSPYAGVGLNVIRAVTAYAGKGIPVIRDGREIRAYALAESMRYTIAPPGELPLKNILFSLVDVPDLKVLPMLWPNLKTLWIGAGTTPEILHRMLNALSHLVKWRTIKSLEIFAPAFLWVINNFRWGEHRGGMFIEVSGQAAGGGKMVRSWHMLAEADDGPLIPAMAIEAVVRKILGGYRPPPGARACLHELDLSDYEQLFEKRKIRTGVRHHAEPANEQQTPLYKRILAGAFNNLPEQVRHFHEIPPGSVLRWTGRAAVTPPSNVIALAVARLMRFPPPAADIPVSVTVASSDAGEAWTRTFDGKAFSSTHDEGRGKFAGLVVERFGPLAFGLAPVLSNGRLWYVARRWTMFGIPMPMALRPCGETFETSVDGLFQFDVDIKLPLIGRIVHYRGWLERGNSD